MPTAFRDLHRSGLFVMPNAWDIGSALQLEALGFVALATTSSGFAMSLGRADRTVTRDELVAHVATLTSVLTVPLSVDSEQCYPDDPGGVAQTVRMLADAGAAGCSIEDFDPIRGAVRPVDEAAERVAEAAAAAHDVDLVLSARAETLLHGTGDLDEAIVRLRSYRQAGADVVFAPSLPDLDAMRRVVVETDAPVNVLRRMDGPSVDELAAAGVRRISVGGALARAAYGEMERLARMLLDGGPTRP
jgi:2-methylisocitrate lyase-like PEP mutase family enzyme